MEEGELAINRNLKEQEEALNYRLQQRKSKNLHSVNPIEGIQVIESINNPDNEGLDSTYEDEINYQLEPNIEITEPIGTTCSTTYLSIYIFIYIYIYISI